MPFLLMTKVKRWFEFIYTILHVFLFWWSAFDIRISLVLTDKTVEGFFIELDIVA